MPIPWGAIALGGSILADKVLGNEGGYTDEQKRMMGIQADVAEMMKQLLASRISNEEKYFPGAMQTVMNYAGQKLGPTRSSLFAKGIFEPRYAPTQSPMAFGAGGSTTPAWTPFDPNAGNDIVEPPPTNNPPPGGITNPGNVDLIGGAQGPGGDMGADLGSDLGTTPTDLGAPWEPPVMPGDFNPLAGPGGGGIQLPAMGSTSQYGPANMAPELATAGPSDVSPPVDIFRPTGGGGGGTDAFSPTPGPLDINAIDTTSGPLADILAGFDGGQATLGPSGVEFAGQPEVPFQEPIDSGQPAEFIGLDPNKMTPPSEGAGMDDISMIQDPRDLLTTSPITPDDEDVVDLLNLLLYGVSTNPPTMGA